MSLGLAGTAPQAILFSEILAWLDLMQVEDESTRNEIAEYVRALDVEFLEWAVKKRTA